MEKLEIASPGEHRRGKMVTRRKRVELKLSDGKGKDKKGAVPKIQTIGPKKRIHMSDTTE